MPNPGKRGNRVPRLQFFVVRRIPDGTEQVLAGPIAGYAAAERALKKARASGHENATIHAECNATGGDDSDDDPPPGPRVVRHTIR